MLVDDVFNEVADAVTGSAEDSGDALDTVKRVIAFPPISAALGIIQASLILLSLAREVLIATRCLLPLLSLILSGIARTWHEHVLYGSWLTPVGTHNIFSGSPDCFSNRR